MRRSHDAILLRTTNLSSVSLLSTVTASLVTALFMLVLPILVTLLLHLTTLFTSFPCRVESFALIMIPVPGEGTIFPVTECTDFIDVISPEFVRQLPFAHP